MAKRIPHCLAIWIDHKEAVVIDTLDPKASRNSKIFTIAGPHHKKNGNSRRGADSHRREDLKEFYDSVIQYLNKAETVLIIGPARQNLSCGKEFNITRNLNIYHSHYRTRRH